MSKVLAVFGATGQQGSSVVNYVLDDPELSQKFKLRAITRDPSSEKAKHLAESGKVEVVKGDAVNRASLETALTGVHTVYIMTTNSLGPDGFEVEYNSAKTIADVAVDKGAEYIIFSTLSAVSKISGGKYTKVLPFEAKAKAESYIRSLPIKSAFVCPGFFMENFHTPHYIPTKTSDDDDSSTWVISQINAPKTLIPFIDVTGDTGKFVGAILANPDKYAGKTFCASTIHHSWEDVAAIFRKVTGKNVVYKQISREEYREQKPFAADVFIDAYSFGEEFGYYGEGSEELVKWAAANARGKLSTLEEYLKRHPVHLT